MSRTRLAILDNEIKEADHHWREACRMRQELISFSSIDITRSDWLDHFRKGQWDGLLARPPAYTTPFRDLYVERLRILNREMGIPVYPALDEIELYENKKYLAYWLKAMQVPHPATHVFYYENEAIDFLGNSSYPLVGKANIGASGRGVIILRSKKEADDYVRDIFRGRGPARSVGPNWRKKGFLNRVLHKLAHPGEFLDKLAYYRSLKTDLQSDFVLLQAYVPHDFEWRCVRIGDSYFAHKKMVKGEMASGSLLKDYANPPLELLDFVHSLTEDFGFRSMAIDLFETRQGDYLVNEMQCIFGQSDPYQMLVDGKPGRYKHEHGTWIFEAGGFNKYESFLLRLDDFLNKLPVGMNKV